MAGETSPGAVRPHDENVDVLIIGAGAGRRSGPKSMLASDLPRMLRWVERVDPSGTVWVSHPMPHW